VTPDVFVTVHVMRSEREPFTFETCWTTSRSPVVKPLPTSHGEAIVPAPVTTRWRAVRA
jgi:hypothetical protein